MRQPARSGTLPDAVRLICGLLNAQGGCFSRALGIAARRLDASLGDDPGRVTSFIRLLADVGEESGGEKQKAPSSLNLTPGATTRTADSGATGIAPTLATPSIPLKTEYQQMVKALLAVA